MIDMTAVKNADPELYAAMDAELKRQQGNIELIASENIVSPAVLAAAGRRILRFISPCSSRGIRSWA